MADSKSRSIGVRLTEEAYKQLQQQAAAEERTLADTARRLINNALQKQETMQPQDAA